MLVEALALPSAEFWRNSHSARRVTHTARRSPVQDSRPGGALTPQRPARDTVDTTKLLVSARKGDPAALDRLVSHVYDELRRLARRQLAREQAGHTLDTGALVHEAYLRLVDLRRIEWQDRAHFFAMSARLMRRILVDHAVRRNAAKRGGGRVAVPLEDWAGASEDTMQHYPALDEALERLERLSPRQCRIVECRFFAGLSVDETATALGVSPATVKRDWTLARAWLNRELA
jgi:RNA polymerase sigma factor (TIGR02999 family)